MKIAKQITIVLLTILATPLMAAEDDAKAFGQFQSIMEGVDDFSFEPVRNAIDNTDMTNRIYAARLIEDEVRNILAGKFWQIVESGFLQSVPPPGSNVRWDLVEFVFKDGNGRASVRFSLPKYEYAFLVFDLRHDNRGRLRVVDWFDSRTGHMFTDEIAEELITLMPTKATTRRQLSVDSPSDLQLFQLTEILKAIRDDQPVRFFEIYDAFDDELRKEPVIAKNAVFMAFAIKDIDRFANVLEIFVQVYSSDPNFALVMSNFYVVIEDYEKSYEMLHKFHENFSANEGALPAKLSALALATGKAEDAEKYALEATSNEPTLELGWWSLLRARAGAGDSQGAIEALTFLEENFGHRLDAAKLRRDRFRAFRSLAESQEFKDWRARRDGR